MPLRCLTVIYFHDLMQVGPVKQGVRKPLLKMIMNESFKIRILKKMFSRIYLKIIMIESFKIKIL